MGSIPGPGPKVVHIDLRRPSRNFYLGGRAWSTNVLRELRLWVPYLRSLHLLPFPATMDQLLIAMRTKPVGKPNDAHVQVYTTSNLVPYPLPLRHCVPLGFSWRLTT